MAITFVLPDMRFAQSVGIDPTTDLALPALATLLGKADRSVQADLPAETWLRQQFNAINAGVAATTLAFDLPGAEPGHWLRADPVHLRADRDRAMLFDASYLDIDAEEAKQLIAALNALYQVDGFQFIAATPQRWYVRLPSAPDFATKPLPGLIGQNVQGHMPSGPNALQWHRFLNEVQMLLYGHPVNDAREQAGKPAINSIWLWGEGAAPVELARPFAAVLADEVFACSLAKLAGAQCQPLPACWPGASLGDDTLFWIDDLSGPAQRGDLYQWRAVMERLERNWFQPLLKDWQDGKLAQLQLVLPGVNQVLIASLGSKVRWRFWRRPAQLSHCLREPI